MNSTTQQTLTVNDIVAPTEGSETDKDSEDIQEKLDIKDDGIVDSEDQTGGSSKENEEAAVSVGDKGGIENGLEDEEKEEGDELKEDGDGWMDVLGSGVLKKKVSSHGSILSVCLSVCPSDCLSLD